MIPKLLRPQAVGDDQGFVYCQYNNKALCNLSWSSSSSSSPGRRWRRLSPSLVAAAAVPSRAVAWMADRCMAPDLYVSTRKTALAREVANPRRLDPEPQTVLPPATPPTTTTPITPTLPTRSFRGSVLCVLGRYQPTERPTQIKERKQPAPSRKRAS